jgi:di/tripeptidase
MIFCANICEEGLGNLIGIKAIVDDLQNSPLFYLVLEGMGLGVIFNRGLGVKRFEITIKTNGGHSWGNFGEPSAIHEIAKFINMFSISDVAKTVRSTYNFGTIRGGTTINSIAQEATTELDIRSENQLILNQIEKKLFSIKQKMETPKVRIQINRIGERPYGALQNGHWLVKLAENALRKLEIEPVLVIGSTDANYPLSLGFPAICLCLTKGGNVHTPEEFIYLDPIKNGFIQIIEIIQNAKET